MFVLKLEFLQLLSKWLDGKIRRMIVDIQISQLPRETLRLEQMSDNLYTLHNIPFSYLLALNSLVQEVNAQGLARANEVDFIEILNSQVGRALDRTYGKAA